VTRLFLGNIPFTATEEDIAQWVESFGFAVDSVEIIRDRGTGNPRGFGFIGLKEGGSTVAIQQLHGKRMAGRIITVNDAKPLTTSVKTTQRQAG